MENTFRTPTAKALVVLTAIAGAALVGGCGGGGERTQVAGRAEFEEVNRQLTTKSGGVAYGATPETIAAATQFASAMKQLQSMMFSGGSGKSFATGGDFLTAVVQKPDAVIVLCHVPELRNYKTKEVRDSLSEMAWIVAQKSVAGLPGVNGETKLVVGLRGVAAYGPIWEGKLGGEATVKNDGVGDRDRLYPYFAPAAIPAPAVIATPAPTEPAPAAATESAEA
jgi:hypothetical protein